MSSSPATVTNKRKPTWQRKRSVTAREAKAGNQSVSLMLLANKISNKSPSTANKSITNQLLMSDEDKENQSTNREPPFDVFNFSDDQELDYLRGDFLENSGRLEPLDYYDPAQGQKFLAFPVGLFIKSYDLCNPGSDYGSISNATAKHFDFKIGRVHGRRLVQCFIEGDTGADGETNGGSSLYFTSFSISRMALERPHLLLPNSAIIDMNGMLSWKCLSQACLQFTDDNANKLVGSTIRLAVAFTKASIANNDMEIQRLQVLLAEYLQSLCDNAETLNSVREVDVSKLEQANAKKMGRYGKFIVLSYVNLAFDLEVEDEDILWDNKPATCTLTQDQWTRFVKAIKAKDVTAIASKRERQLIMFRLMLDENAYKLLVFLEQCSRVTSVNDFTGFADNKLGVLEPRIKKCLEEFVITGCTCLGNRHLKVGETHLKSSAVPLLRSARALLSLTVEQRSGTNKTIHSAPSAQNEYEEGSLQQTLFLQTKPGDVSLPEETDKVLLQEDDDNGGAIFQEDDDNDNGGATFQEDDNNDNGGAMFQEGHDDGGVMFQEDDDHENGISITSSQEKTPTASVEGSFGSAQRKDTTAASSDTLSIARYGGSGSGLVRQEKIVVMGKSNSSTCIITSKLTIDTPVDMNQETRVQIKQQTALSVASTIDSDTCYIAGQDGAMSKKPPRPRQERHEDGSVVGQRTYARIPLAISTQHDLTGNTHTPRLPTIEDTPVWGKKLSKYCRIIGVSVIVVVALFVATNSVSHDSQSSVVDEQMVEVEHFAGWMEDENELLNFVGMNSDSRNSQSSVVDDEQMMEVEHFMAWMEDENESRGILCKTNKLKMNSKDGVYV